MFDWAQINDEIHKAKVLIRRGHAHLALERLNSLLAQQIMGTPQYCFHCAAILRVMGLAAASLGDPFTAEKFQERASELLRVGDEPQAPQRAEIFMSIAEDLVSRGREMEAEYFADAALECVFLERYAFISAEVKQFRRRHYGVTRRFAALVNK